MFHTVRRVIDHLYIVINVHVMYIYMEKKDIHVRVSKRRYDKLRLVAQAKEKTITQIIEDYIDRLPTPEIDNHSDTHS
ncbi:hypothetical protein NIES4073_57480 [Kalymmatonema gypsitolerans NIES-4073]|nr:hypothetical protein NIES4073_57480 [Scytonema sp. NIES-4073]